MHKLRNHFSNKCIEKVDSIRISNIRDRVNADQHIHAIETEKELRTNHIVLTLSIYPEELLMYICRWPNIFLNSQILVEVFGHMS